MGTIINVLLLPINSFFETDLVQLIGHQVCLIDTLKRFLLRCGGNKGLENLLLKTDVNQATFPIERVKPP